MAAEKILMGNELGDRETAFRDMAVNGEKHGSVTPWKTGYSRPFSGW